MKSFLKKENGAAAVFVALGMTLLLGCAALAVDLGASYHARIDLQDAVDNAAYAAGSLLPSNKNAAVQNKVTAAVEASLRANGVDPEEIEKLLSEARADERRKLEGAISIKESMLDGLRQTSARLEDENHRLQLVITDLQAKLAETNSRHADANASACALNAELSELLAGKFAECTGIISSWKNEASRLLNSQQTNIPAQREELPACAD